MTLFPSNSISVGSEAPLAEASQLKTGKRMADMEQDKGACVEKEPILEHLDSKFFSFDRTALSSAPPEPAGATSVGDTFSTRGKLWVNRGWYSAVGHVAGEANDGECAIISRHETVHIVRRASPEEATEAFGGVSKQKKS